jgi:hypothetical protein
MAQFAQVINVLVKNGPSDTSGSTCRCPRLTLTGRTAKGIELAIRVLHAGHFDLNRQPQAT